MPRFAVPIALFATLLRALTEPFAWRHFLLHVAVNVVGAGVVGGYVAGTLLWELIVAGRRRPGAAREDRGRGRPRNAS